LNQSLFHLFNICKKVVEPPIIIIILTQIKVPFTAIKNKIQPQQDMAWRGANNNKEAKKRRNEGGRGANR